MSKLIYALATLYLVAAGVVIGQEYKPCNFTDTKPTPTVQHFKVENSTTKDVCVVAELAAYFKVGQKYIDLKQGTLNNKSSCEEVYIDFDNCSQLHLNILNKSGRIVAEKLDVFYKDSANNTISLSNLTSLFNVSEANYFKCKAEREITFNNETKIELSQFAVEAFRSQPSTQTNFTKTAEVCREDSQTYSDWVRIAVGICLVALVVIVLVAYFIGRRRWSERSSYESV